MGGGKWTRDAFKSYTATASVSKGIDCSFDALTDSVVTSASAQQMFTQRSIAPELNPRGVMRECLDTTEHPETIPVILALDVTGSMGSAATEIAKKLNVIMTNLYDKVKDVEFLIMGIGDLAYDSAPIQASQFESDVRIAEQLDKIYFEGRGGGNSYESYTAAWYFGLHHTKLDCLKRGKKGIIITMGDETLNPYLPGNRLAHHIGDTVQADINTNDLYAEAVKKFDIYHLMVDDRATSYRRYRQAAQQTFGKYLDGQHLIEVTLDNLADTIVDIVTNASGGRIAAVSTSEGISW